MTKFPKAYVCCTLLGIVVLAKGVGSGQKELCEIVMEVFGKGELLVQHFIDEKGPQDTLRRCVQDYTGPANTFLTVMVGHAY